MIIRGYNRRKQIGRCLVWCSLALMVIAAGIGTVYLWLTFGAVMGSIVALVLGALVAFAVGVILS